MDASCSQSEPANISTQVPKLETPQRLDQFLLKQFPLHSRSYFQGIIQQGLVWVDGAIAKKRLLLRGGERIRLTPPSAQPTRLEPEFMPLDILYEDEALLVVDKAAGVVVHPGAGHSQGTLAAAAVYHCRGMEKEFLDNRDLFEDPSLALRPGIVHRLDRFTSGVMVIAKTVPALRALSLEFSERRVKKIYRMICWGVALSGAVTGYIQRDTKDRQRFYLRDRGAQAPKQEKWDSPSDLDSDSDTSEPDPRFDGGRWSHTTFKWLRSTPPGRFESARQMGGAGLHEIEADLHTGRTHQIRVHCKSCRAPILGDPIYGCIQVNKTLKVERPLLHAYSLSFKHPSSGEVMSFQAPLPQDYLNTIEDYFQVKA